ncbi:MAG: hypothetical protein KAS66_10710 [Candidatus Omnitrophica bacterium]|nr:hypothetical protein [Candidatus Omnitrophota bacterium]
MKRTNLQAIRESIRHWMLDIVRPLKADNIIYSSIWASSGESVKCFNTDCAMCILLFTANWCTCCPLSITVGECAAEKSIYRKFRSKPNKETATDMVRALVCTYWAEKNGENDY